MTPSLFKGVQCSTGDDSFPVQRCSITGDDSFSVQRCSVLPLSGCTIVASPPAINNYENRSYRLRGEIKAAINAAVLGTQLTRHLLISNGNQ